MVKNYGLIMFDETLSSLYESLRLTIIEFLKTEFGNSKNMLVISHEVSERVYDPTIDCGEE